MTWKDACKHALEKEGQPMQQATYWVIYISCGATFALKTVESAAAGSYQFILSNPAIGSSSWLTGTFF